MRILCKIILPIELSAPNQMLRTYWTVRYKQQKDYILLLNAAIEDTHRAKPGEKRRLEIFSYRKKLLRDKDNLYFSVKILLDAMTKTRLLWDDSMKYTDYSIFQEVDRHNPRTEVIVYVLDEKKLNERRLNNEP